MPEINSGTTDTDTGRIIVIPTPIGNLGDISTRQREALLSCDVLACEDTRVTKALLAKLGLSLAPDVKVFSHREENEDRSAESLVEMVRASKTVGLLCDAGTPGLSDPGFRLMRRARSEGLPVTPLPGPFAASTALCASGLPTDGFWFVGFLPPKSSARRRFLEENRNFPHTLIFYESVHRVAKFLGEIVEVLGHDRTIAVARELTKLHETSVVGRAENVQRSVLSGSLKGEFVIMIAKAGFNL